MNDIALTNQQPAYLAALNSTSGLNSVVTGGIKAGQSIYSIGIRASRFRLLNPQGEEYVVPQLHLDVIIVDANPNLSKIYYESKYNPDETEAKAPDCWSDNGTGPSARASKPQSLTCATCPHNIWGSKVTENGKESRACSDVKKIAVLLADNPDGPAYLLRLPPASLKPLYEYADAANKRKIDLVKVVTRLSFDEKVDFPKLKFTPQGYINETQLQCVLEVVGSDEVKQLTNSEDVAITELKSRPQAAAPAPTPQPQVTDPFAGLPPQPAAAPVPTPQAPASEPGTTSAAPASAEAPKRRRRAASSTPTEAAAPAPAPQPAAQTTAAPPPLQPQDNGGFFANMRNNAANGHAPAATPAARVNTNPQPTDASLDALLANALNL